MSARVLVAGGGTAGHVVPALTVADAIVEMDPDATVLCLGTAGGLENTLVPQRGYRLELIPQVKFTRKLNKDTLAIPARLRTTVKRTGEIMDAEKIDVVVGFGGYVSLPAYLAARRRKIPVVVHEANVRPGIANKIGARFAVSVLTAAPDSGLRNARLVGNPVRKALRELDVAATRPEARAFFGLDPDAPTVVVVGGSLGAQRLNESFGGAAAALTAAGVGVLHAHGKGKTVPGLDVAAREAGDLGTPPYVAVEYVDRMDLAYAAADLLVCRSGAMTVAEIGALGIPVVYVPLAFGNGEQRLNAVSQVEAGAARMIDDATMSADRIRTEILPLVTDPAALSAMRAAAGGTATDPAETAIARAVLAAAGTRS